MRVCVGSFQAAAIESVVSEPELCGSGVDRHSDIVHWSLLVVEWDQDKTICGKVHNDENARFQIFKGHLDFTLTHECPESLLHVGGEC